MISVKKLIKMARKWQKLAAKNRKRISLPRTTEGGKSESCSSMAQKGHFVVYTSDQRRFVIPLFYLNNFVIRELFTMAEEEFGLPCVGPITLPCDAVFMEYVISLIQRRAAKDVVKALLASMTTACHLEVSNLHREQYNQWSLICGF